MIYFTYEQILNISSLQLITLGIDLGITTIDILAGWSLIWMHLDIRGIVLHVGVQFLLTHSTHHQLLL